MEFLYSALHSFAASAFLCFTTYRSAVTGTVTHFEMILGVLIIYIVFHNNNSSKRYLCLNGGDTNISYFHWLFKTFLSADFWLCSLIVVLPVSVLGQLVLKTPFYVLAAIMVFLLLISEAQQCRRWAEAYYDYCELRLEPDLKEHVEGCKSKPVKKILNMALGCIAVGFIRIILYLFTLATPILVFVAYEAGSIIIFILCAIPVALILRGYGSMRKRRAAIKELEGICRQYGYTLKDNTRLLRGLYYSTGKTDVIIEKGDQSYAISFLPVPYKISSIVFYTDKKYNFRPRILGMNISLPLHSIGFDCEYKEKYLLFTKAAKNAKLWDGRRYSDIDNGEVLYGAKVYSVSAFSAYFDRQLRKDSV